MNTARDWPGEAPEPGWQPVELRYCGRCGALCVMPAEARDSSCPGCALTLRWLYQEGNDATRKH